MSQLTQFLNTPVFGVLSMIFVGGSWCFVGAIAGKHLPFSSRGIDFAMTALFLVVLTDQCRVRANIIPAVIGVVSAITARIFFPVNNLLIPAMIMMTAAFLIFRKGLEKRLKEGAES